MTSKKISLSVAKKLAPVVLLGILNKMKKKLKKDEVLNKVFKEYGLDISELDYVPMMFKDLDVSAKCDHGVIYFNWKLLCDGFENNYSYAVHELSHFCQRTSGTKPTQSADDGDYLHNPHEQEGFSNQVKYIAKEEGDHKAEKYVDDLLDHHDKDGEEKEELKEVLMSEADDKKERIKNIKHLLVKYHPDKATGDLEKFKSLINELKTLQHKEPEIIISPVQKSQWGDWYQNHIDEIRKNYR